MHRLVWLGISIPALAAATSPILGVDPAKQHLYQPSSNSQFKCLNSNIYVPWEAVNDDYCDCPDGSDEPGTSACSHLGGQVFWCANKGHLPASVWSSSVGDGVCDIECCDGSDEPAGRCPNVCKERHETWKRDTEAANEIRRKGGVVRSGYIAQATKERTRLDNLVTSLTSRITEQSNTVESLRVRLERLESASAAQLARKQRSPLYTSLVHHREVLTTLRGQLDQAQKQRDELIEVLKGLKQGYNPNYQDMAVKAAVVGFTELVNDDGQFVNGQNVPSVEQAELDRIDRLDLVGLAMGDDGDDDDDDETDESSGNLLFQIEQYIPEALYESIRDSILTTLIRLGILGGGSKQKDMSAKTSQDAAHTSEARQQYQSATTELKSLETQLESTRSTLAALSPDVAASPTNDAPDYGPSAEWFALSSECIDRVQGDYTYTLCWMRDVYQKSNKDGARHLLGRFAGWTGPGGREDEKRYSGQLYDRGLKCWNGPERSVRVHIACGEKNELLHVAEPEKCEYAMHVTSPALCWPGANLSRQDGIKHEEL